MNNNDEKSSVREEQFGEEKNNPENMVKKEDTSEKIKDAQIGENNDNEFVDSEKIAEKTSGHLVEIGKSGQMIFRVVSKNNIFDISPISGSFIEDDLFDRDFTINALAFDLSSGKIIDCMNSLQDIADRKIRMVSKTAFQKDPIRLIRAYRMEATLVSI